MPAPAEFVRDQERLHTLGITARELEVPVGVLISLVSAGVLRRGRQDGALAETA